MKPGSFAVRCGVCGKDEHVEKGVLRKNGRGERI